MYCVYKPNSEEGYPIASFDTMREAEECAEYYEEMWGYDMTITKE